MNDHDADGPWTLRLAPVASYGYPAGTDTPTAIYERDTEDGGTLVALLWGQGRAKSPWFLHVMYQPPETDDGPAEPRWPTLDELQSATSRACLPGAILTLSPGFVAGNEAVEAPLRGVVVLIQAAAVSGSAAATRLELSGAGTPRAPRVLNLNPNKA